MDSVDGNFGCGLVSVWEERIWLDRREISCQPLPARTVFGKLGAWLTRAVMRMQLGPVASAGWCERDPDAPF